MYKNIIISLDIMQKEVYDKFMSFSHLQFKPADEIWNYYIIPQNVKTTFSKSLFS